MEDIDELEGILNQDIYGRSIGEISPSLKISPVASGYEDESLQFDRDLYANSFEEEFARELNCLKLTPNARSILMGYFRIATSDDVVLGNYTPHEAKIIVETISLELEREKMRLRGRDMLSAISGAWDSAAKQIETACKTRVNRSIGGWERTAQITQRSYVKQDSTNEEISEKERNKSGMFSRR